MVVLCASCQRLRVRERKTVQATWGSAASLRLVRCVVRCNVMLCCVVCVRAVRPARSYNENAVDERRRTRRAYPDWNRRARNC